MKLEIEVPDKLIKAMFKIPELKGFTIGDAIFVHFLKGCEDIIDRMPKEWLIDFIKEFYPNLHAIANEDDA